MWTEDPFIQKVSGEDTSPFLDTDELKTALRARKVSRAFEKRAPGSAVISTALAGFVSSGFCLKQLE